MKNLYATLLLLSSTSVWALKSDRQADMEIEADRNTGSMNLGQSQLLGNVRIRQGSLLIEADRADISEKDGEVQVAVLHGAPATLQQMIEDQGQLQARAQRIEYLLVEDRVIFSGKVQIERPRGSLSGERVVYNLKTAEFNAGGDGGRVRMVIKPKTKAP
jgi:lipopolysaccharide export system protein LptA